MKCPSENPDWAQFKTSLLEQFQYRAAMAIWMIGRILAFSRWFWKRGLKNYSGASA